MTSELRWSLLIIGVVFIIALMWWERRKPRQANQGLERRDTSPESAARVAREPPLTLPEIRAREPLAPREPLITRELPVVEIGAAAPLVPVLDATQAAADAQVTVADSEAEMTFEAGADPLPTLEEPAAEAEAEPEPLAADAHLVPPTVHSPPLPREALPELPAAPSLRVEWPDDTEQRRVLTVRLVAPQPERFAGRSLRQALAAEGFVLGQFSIFHKGDDERRAVLSAASLTRPGTFDADTMDSQHYGGLSLFAVLPGPKPARQTFDELVFTARNLSERLHGVLQDEQGGPLTANRVAFMREQCGAAS